MWRVKMDGSATDLQGHKISTIIMGERRVIVYSRVSPIRFKVWGSYSSLSRANKAIKNLVEQLNQED